MESNGPQGCEDVDSSLRKGFTLTKSNLMLTGCRGESKPLSLLNDFLNM